MEWMIRSHCLDNLKRPTYLKHCNRKTWVTLAGNICVHGRMCCRLKIGQVIRILLHNWPGLTCTSPDHASEIMSCSSAGSHGSSSAGLTVDGEGLQKEEPEDYWRKVKTKTILDWPQLDAAVRWRPPYVNSYTSKQINQAATHFEYRVPETYRGFPQFHMQIPEFCLQMGWDSVPPNIYLLTVPGNLPASVDAHRAG
jgi:hypothetical protein